MTATSKVQLLQGGVPQDFQQVCGPIGTFGAIAKAPGVLKRGLWGNKNGNLLPLLLQVTFASPFATVYFTFLAFQCCQGCQSNSRDIGLNIRKKTRRLTNWPNIATKFARRGTVRSLLLSNWSSSHHAASATQWTKLYSNMQSSTSPGESSARLPAGLRPHRHLWCLCQSTWSAQKRTVGIKGWQSVAAPLASNFCQSVHVQLSISHFWPFNVAKCCQTNCRDNGLYHSKKNTASNELARHRNQVCKTRHPMKFASLKLVQLAPRSFCHAVGGIFLQRSKFNFSRGELRKTSSRSAAPSAPLVSLSKHLECSKGDCGATRTAICCRSSCK